MLAELAGIRLPPRTEPPAEPVPFTPQTYVGSYGGPLATYEVTAAEGGRDVTETPKGFAAEVDAKPTTIRYISLGADRFVAAERDEGGYRTLAFLDDGSFLCNTRAVPRISPTDPASGQAPSASTE